MAGAKGIMDAILSGSKPTPAVVPVRPDHATARLGLVAEMSEGNLKSRLQRLVDPTICKIWSGNARRYELLTQADCQDLIDGLLAQGKQEFPAIVRSIAGRGPNEYEIICGARRHWAISWLRANNYPEFKFLIEVREMNDEEAFRLSDIENRDRADVSDFERARIYLSALELHYDGQQARMAKRLEVTTTWLSRYLALARLPNDIIAAFDDPREIGINVAAILSPLLNNPVRQSAVLGEARKLADKSAREGRLSLAETLKALANAGKSVSRVVKPQMVTSDGGKVLIEIRRPKSKTVDIRLHLERGESVDALLDLLKAKLKA
jgi:ParB family transcriptional regulator, chromosome partitioning protein